MPEPELYNGHFHDLKQFITVTWDGDVVSKSSRDFLISKGFLFKIGGFTTLTRKGLQVLIDLGGLKP